MIQLKKLFRKKIPSVIDDNLEINKIASKHSYYLKHKQMEETKTVNTKKSSVKVIIGTVLILLAGYFVADALPAPLTTLDVLQARYEDSDAAHHANERDLAVGKLMVFKEISRVTHEVLKKEMEKNGLEYTWNTPEGFIDLHMVGVTEDTIKKLEEKARWVLEEGDDLSGDFQ